MIPIARSFEDGISLGIRSRAVLFLFVRTTVATGPHPGAAIKYAVPIDWHCSSSLFAEHDGLIGNFHSQDLVLVCLCFVPLPLTQLAPKKLYTSKNQMSEHIPNVFIKIHVQATKYWPCHSIL